MVGIYWTLLPPLVALLVVFELLKSSDQQPNINDLLRRTVISILLLLSFSTVINLIAMLSDGITSKIDQTQTLWDEIKHLGPNSQGESGGSLFDLRGHIIYFFSIGAYLIAYIGFFSSIALMHFVWAILYICAPLMLLCYIPRSTAGIVGNLYRGLISVATWKILWTLLGSLLLKLALNPEVTGADDYILSMVMNLLIGICMLLIPIFTKSLLGDGLQSASSALAAAPGLMFAKAAMVATKMHGAKMAGGALGAAGFLAKPLTNPISGRAKVFASRVHPHLKNFANKYSEAGLPDSAKELIKKERRKKFATERNNRK